MTSIEIDFTVLTKEWAIYSGCPKHIAMDALTKAKKSNLELVRYILGNNPACVDASKDVIRNIKWGLTSHDLVLSPEESACWMDLSNEGSWPDVVDVVIRFYGSNAIE